MARAWLDDLIRQTVIVHCKHDGPSFKGVLMAVHDDALVLQQALLLEPEVQTLMDHDTVVFRENIAFLQVLSA